MVRIELDTLSGLNCGGVVMFERRKKFIHFDGDDGVMTFVRKSSIDFVNLDGNVVEIHVGHKTIKCTCKLETAIKFYKEIVGFL